MFRLLLSRILIVVSVLACWPRLAANAADAESPRLVVVVSIDQFPYEYLERMQAGFSPDGIFLPMMNDGANYVNCHHAHAFTVTAPGHSVLLTGAYPNRTGIVNNSWFDHDAGREIYCIEDTGSPIVGAPTPKPTDGASPRNLLVDTVGDVLKQATDNKARVFGVTLKDRAGVLMAGHRADAVYWFEGAPARCVTSRHYRADLPDYIEQFNADAGTLAYGKRTWDLLYAMERYTLHRPDDYPYEEDLPPLGRAFPHRLPDGSDGRYFGALRGTPFGNELVLEVARLVVTHEELGRDDVPDILVIGLSANDIVGHHYGPYSLEVEDMTYRTDRQIGEFAAFVDDALEAAPWAMAISSDHGVVPIPEFAKEVLGLPAARNPLGNTKEYVESLEQMLRQKLGVPADGARYVALFDETSVYLNHKLPELAGDRFVEAQNALRDKLMEHPAMAAAFTREELLASHATEGIEAQFERTFNPERSGDVLYTLKPYQIQTDDGTTHGTPWEYDTHVPLLLRGAGIHPGRYTTSVSPGCLAPTVARLMGVDPPATTAVEPLHEALEPAAVPATSGAR